jgi:HD-GYP domain-containing protein (c-di-GMP phosphodiesterase class II)
MLSADLIVEFLEFVERQPRQSFRQLLDKVLHKSRMITQAEAGTIFILRRAGHKVWLEPVSIQNDSIAVRTTDFTVPLGSSAICSYVAETGNTVRLDDVYKIPKGAPYRLDPSREYKGYRTRSMFCFALTNYQDRVIGVVQLINAKHGRRKEPVPFDEEVEKLVVPITRVVGTLVERADMLEKIRSKNRILRERNRELDAQRAKIAKLHEETEEAFQLSIKLLARAAELHDEETGNHIVRVNEYSYFIAKQLGLPDEYCEKIRYSAQLHDVGKMSVNSAVLKKQGPLNAEERQEMDRHTVYGYQILSASPRLDMGAEIALNHHEKWDGSGYPNGIAGEQIPLSARIVQLGDVYDALRSERPYKPAFNHKDAVRILTKGDERIDILGHFDPDLVQLFADNHKQFNHIWRNWAD